MALSLTGATTRGGQENPPETSEQADREGDTLRKSGGLVNLKLLITKYRFLLN